MPLTEQAEGERSPVELGAGIQAERPHLGTGGMVAALEQSVDTEGGRSSRFPSAGTRRDAEPGTFGARRLDYADWFRMVGSTAGKGLHAVEAEGRT